MQGYRDRKAEGNTSFSKAGTGPQARAVLRLKEYDIEDGTETGDNATFYTESSINVEIAREESHLLDLMAIQTDVEDILA